MTPLPSLDRLPSWEFLQKLFLFQMETRQIDLNFFSILRTVWESAKLLGPVQLRLNLYKLGPTRGSPIESSWNERV